MKKINCILLVDDNDSDNVYHKIIIKKANVCNEVHIALDGTEAMEYITNSAKPDHTKDYPKADLILLDINMPRMDGFEFLEEYHKLDEELRSSIVITMLTTSLNPADEKRAADYKALKGFYKKPLTVEVLQEIIAKHF